ncbi:very short patch repair protein [Cryobacterium sp. MP_M3]|uniref:very short patch repair protein n=1 Tax=unclassified Cryobacterium TaxID=2649013 RepID=UPI0035B2D934
MRRTTDIVFTRAKVAIFIDGCFWHGCPAHYQRPVANRNYWDEKILRNRARDAETRSALADKGWRVLEFWEHEEAEAVVEIIREQLNAALAALRSPSLLQRQ